VGLGGVDTHGEVHDLPCVVDGVDEASAREHGRTPRSYLSPFPIEPCWRSDYGIYQLQEERATSAKKPQRGPQKPWQVVDSAV